MITVSMVYRCLIAIVLCCLHCTQWLHRCCVQFVSRHRYTITVNIGFTRHNDLRTRAADDRTEKIQFNKPTQVVALIVNERIPDVDLCQVIVNSIVFFRRLNIEHLIIYDYQGYIKACQNSIMDYVQAYDKTAQSTFPLPTLHFQSLTESNETLTRVARQVCEQVQRGDIDADAIQVDTIARCYTKLSNLSDINLAILIGPIKSALGLHPWLTRLTEFITIDSYRQLQTSNAFRHIVQRYNRIEQRQGR